MSRESIGKEIANIAVDLINTLREGNLKYQEDTEDRKQKLKAKQTISMEEVSQKVQQLKQEFEQEIKEKEHDFELKMKKKKRKAEIEIKNYQRFLNSIEDLREKLEEFYPKMQPAIVLVIHEHATQLLHSMYESTDEREKLIGKKKFIQFLALVSEDTNQRSLQQEGAESSMFPNRTLKHINETTR